MQNIDTENISRIADFIPSVALTDDYLLDWYDSSSVENIFVPTGRPESFFTGGGIQEHSGDILQFYIQKPDDTYVLFRYEVKDGPGSGMVWTCREINQTEDSELLDGVLEKFIEKRFELLSE